MSARYMNPYTDFGFKKLFGEEANKDLLIDFLNQLLPEKHQIDVLNFKNTENIGEQHLDRKAIFDIHCQSKSGERFVVEMQKAKIKHFKDRAIFYTTFPIREQATKGEWDFKLSPIYYITILDFEYDQQEKKRKLHRDVQLYDQDGELFYDKLRYIVLQMPLFLKKESELKTRYDKWLYFLKNLKDFDKIPKILKEPVFEKAFTIAEIANLNTQDRAAYQRSLRYYRDLVNVINTKYEEGMEKGVEIGMEKGVEIGMEKGVEIGMEKGVEIGMEKGAAKELQKVALEMLKVGIPLTQIMVCTGLTEIQLQELKAEL